MNVENNVYVTCCFVRVPSVPDDTQHVNINVQKFSSYGDVNR